MQHSLYRADNIGLYLHIRGVALPIVIPKTVNSRARVRRLVFACVTGFSFGVLAAILRPYGRVGSVQYELVCVLLIIMPTIMLGVWFSQRNVPWKRGLLWLLLELVVMSLMFSVQWYAIRQELLGDMITAMSVYTAVVVAVAIVIEILWQLRYRPIAGPYCRHCGYCLIGAVNHVCAECGSAFTLEDLSITENDLHPDTMKLHDSVRE